MPTRISCMYPGSSGASRNLNMMSEGNGNNKWQGLPGLTNLRSSLVVPVTTRAYGTNRDKVFCMNQLGGVGRFSNMFASTADGVKLPCQGSGGNIPTNNLGLQLLQTDWGSLSVPEKNTALTNLITTFGINNQLWIDDFDTAAATTPSSLQSQVLDIYNSLADNRTFLNYLANTKSGGGILYIPISETNMNDTTLNTVFSNIYNNFSSSSGSRVLSIVYIGSNIRSQIPGMYDQNGFFNGVTTPVSGAPATSVPTSGSSVGFISYPSDTPGEFDQSTYIIRPGST